MKSDTPYRWRGSIVVKPDGQLQGSLTDPFGYTIEISGTLSSVIGTPGPVPEPYRLPGDDDDT